MERFKKDDKVIVEGQSGVFLVKRRPNAVFSTYSVQSENSLATLEVEQGKLKVFVGKDREH